MIARAAAALALAALIFSGGTASAYESPGKPTGFVNDLAGIIDDAAQTALEARITEYEKQSGNEIAVVTIESLDGDTIENFAVELFKDWGIGKKGKDTGVLLLVAPGDRVMRIEVGYGLEPDLTDAESSWLISRVLTPKFKKNDFSGGITDGVNAIIEAIGNDVVPTQTDGDDTETAISFGMLVALLWIGSAVLRIISTALGSTKSWWAGGALGAVAGLIILVLTTFLIGATAIIALTIIGLIFDYIVSRSYKQARARGVNPWWFGGFDGGGSGGRTGGSFGGFGGGSSGGGGASGRW